MSNNIGNILEHYLNPTLGLPKKHYNQYKWNCPVCDQGNKYNLEINLNKNSTRYLKAHCWSCGLKGLRSILKDYACDPSWKELQEFRYSTTTNFIKKESVEKELNLPQGIRSFEFSKEVTAYLLNERKCSLDELRKRKVKYVFDKEDELYNNIIFPFYDEYNKLICFTSQNFETKKYKNHGSTKFVAYREFITPFFPIIITEGIYDALSVPNAIPLLGTKINKEI